MHHAFLAAQAAKNTPAQLVSRYRREAVDSFNIAAHAASGTSVPPIAVVTPRTGWWESTAERAGGLVAWLAALHAAGHLQRAGHLSRACGPGPPVATNSATWVCRSSSTGIGRSSPVRTPGCTWAPILAARAH